MKNPPPPPPRPDCSKHKTDLAGISDMRKLAEMIGDMNYKTLVDLFFFLSLKFSGDAHADLIKGRDQLAAELNMIATEMGSARMRMFKAWTISKKYME